MKERSKRKQRGAVAVEFALVSPLLFLVLFAIIEFGWTFSQILDTRHATREAARLAAVNFQPTADLGKDQTDLMIAEVCTRLEDSSTSRVELTFISATDVDAGDLAKVRVERDLEQLTGFFGPVLDSILPSSEVEFRLERRATWAESVGKQACP